MSTEREKILNMLAEGKVTASEAGDLLDAIETSENPKMASIGTESAVLPNYLYVKVEPKSAEGDKVNIRVPLKLLKAGMKLKALIPENATTKINDAIRDKGINFDLNDINENNFENIIEALSEMTVDVDSGKETVRIFCG